MRTVTSAYRIAPTAVVRKVYTDELENVNRTTC